MKYEIKDDRKKDGDNFELELKIIKEKARSRIMTWTLAVWLLLIVAVAAAATVNGHHGEIQQELGRMTPLITLIFGWYLGKETGK